MELYAEVVYRWDPRVGAGVGRVLLTVEAEADGDATTALDAEVRVSSGEASEEAAPALLAPGDNRLRLNATVHLPPAAALALLLRPSADAAAASDFRARASSLSPSITRASALKPMRQDSYCSE